MKFCLGNLEQKTNSLTKLQVKEDYRGRLIEELLSENHYSTCVFPFFFAFFFFKWCLCYCVDVVIYVMNDIVKCMFRLQCSLLEFVTLNIMMVRYLDFNPLA